MDLRIEGAVLNTDIKEVRPQVCAICPEDYPGFTPRPAVHEGDAVLPGTILLTDKKHPELALVSPSAGKVKAIVRGERRKLLRVEVEVAPASDCVKYDIPSDAAGLRKLLAQSGLLAMMRQRPYGIVPDPDAQVRDIFVTAFDSAPLAADMKVQLGSNVRKYIEAAVKALGKFTSGKVYISHRGDLEDVPGAEMVTVSGPHPSGLVGVQIANIKPINKGETVWTLDLELLYKIGKLICTGSTDFSTVVAVTGPEVETPCMLRTLIGAGMECLVKDNLKKDDRHKRIISGNVLTGTAVGEGEDAFLRYPYQQVTVIAEGDDVAEFMGWASLAPSKMSNKLSFPGRLFVKLFKPDARLNGGRRAMIMSGEYDKVMPMDILPEYLLKAIMAKDIDRMEALGIYEVVPEDFALAEYADTSKLPLQQIVRDGLDYLRKETE